jgi:hypothetical protein
MLRSLIKAAIVLPAAVAAVGAVGVIKTVEHLSGSGSSKPPRCATTGCDNKWGSCRFCGRTMDE